MLTIKRTRNHDTQFAGIHLPLGAVYTVLPECDIHGKHHLRTVVWIEDIQTAMRNRHFYAFFFTTADKHPRKVYVDSYATGYMRQLKAFIMSLPDNANTITTTTKSQIHNALNVPHDREVGKYIQRGRANDPALNPMSYNAIDDRSPKTMGVPNARVGKPNKMSNFYSADMEEKRLKDRIAFANRHAND